MKIAAVAPFVVCVTLLLGSGPAAGQNVKTPPSTQRTGPEPYQGLKSVAERADSTWQAVHVNFRKVMTDTVTADRCDPILKQSVTTAQAALKERTRAWTEFYERRRLDSEELKRAHATVIADIEGQIRTEEAGLTRLVEMTDELTRRRTDLKTGGAGLDPQNLAKAEESLDTQLRVRQETIENSRKMIEQYKEILKTYSAEQSNGTDDATLATMFKDLIKSQNGLYESVYRSQELRLSLECRPRRPDPPPAPPRL